MRKIILIILCLSIISWASGDKNYRSVKRADNDKNRSSLHVLHKKSKNFVNGVNSSESYLRKFLKTLSSTSKLDSAIYYQEGIKKKYEVTFNSNGLIVMEVIKNNDLSNNWVDDFRRSLDYNNDNKQTIELFEYYDTELNKWFYDWRYFTEYLNDGAEELWLDQIWNQDTETWESWWRQTVNIQMNNMRFVEEIWNENLNDWINDYRAVINYDDNGNELNYFGEVWDQNSGQWTDAWKDTTFYDTEGKLIGYKSYYFDNGDWYAWDNESYYYDDNGNLIEYLIRDIDYNSGNWIDYQRVTYSYDNRGNLITEFLDNLDPEYYNYKTTYQYDSNDNMTYAMNQSVDPTNSSTESVTGDIIFSDIYANYGFSASELIAYYSMPTSVEFVMEPIDNKFSLSQNYPNPFNPTTTIIYNIPNSQSYSNLPTILKVYDILGNEVVTLVNKVQYSGLYEINFDGNLLSSGQYFYRITVGDYSLTKSMLLLK